MRKGTKIFLIGFSTISLVGLVLLLFLIKVGGVEYLSMPVPFNYQTEQGKTLSGEAWELHEQGKYEKAIQLYKKALIIEPKNPRIYYDISECYLRLNDTWSAIKNLDSAILIDSTFAGFYANRGLMYYKLDYTYTAIGDLEHAILIDPESWPSYANLAIVYHKLGNEEKACETIRKARSLGLDLAEFKTLQPQLIRIQTMCE